MLKQSLLIAALIGSPAFAEPAQVKSVHAIRTGGTYTFDVTLSHPDKGWDHYADAWRIKDAAGNILGIRDLAHPHVAEQPFTRSLSGVQVPEGAKVVFVEAHDTVSGWTPEPFRVTLP